MPDSTSTTIEINGESIVEVKDCDYSSDVLAIGEECHLTVVNENQRLTDALPVGSTVRIFLSNPFLNNGSPTLKFLGVLVDRMPQYDAQGSVIKLVAADLGWHLTTCSAPLWFNLRSGILRDLVEPGRAVKGPGGKPSYFIDPSFGFQGLRGDNAVNRQLKQGTKGAIAEEQNFKNPVFTIQTEAGDTISEIILPYARRLNRLVNVSVDGRIQVWNPDYKQAPSYQIRCLAGGRDNNVISARGYQSCRTLWTQVLCVGEQVPLEAQTNPLAPNATKKRGETNKAVLPFVHRLTFSDPEMFSNGLAQQNAEWRYRRDLYDSWYVQYTVPEHWQVGPDGVTRWWESDTMVSIDDDELNLHGNYYVSAVQYSSTIQGDLTTVTVRLPGLLSAAFGELPDPPSIFAKK